MRLLPVVLLLVLPGLAHAQPERPQRPVTLRAAIESALRKNPALGAAIADKDVADGGVKSARGLDDPLIDATAIWNENRQEVAPGAPVQQPTSSTLSGALSLTQPIPTGGRVGLRLSTEYDRTTFATESSANPGQYDRQSGTSYSPSLQLVLEHSLLRGIGVDVARADRRRAATRRDLATTLRDAAAARLLRDVVTGYWNLAYAAREVEIRRAWVDAAREQLQLVAAAIDVGKRPPSASAEVEVVIAMREVGALSAEQAVNERSLELERLIGQPIDRHSSALLAVDLPSNSDVNMRVEDALAAAMDNNPELRAAEAQSRVTAVELAVTANSLLPRLDVAVSGGPGGYAADLPTAYSELTRFRGYSINAGLIFQEPIGRHSARGAHEGALGYLRKANLGEVDVRQEIASTLLRGFAAIEIAKKRAEIFSRSLTAAELDLASQKALFESGRSSNFDVLRRQDQLAQIKLNMVLAQADYARALAMVEALTGTILTRYGVRFES